MKRGLKVLEEWCKEWAVEVNVEKYGGDAYQEERCLEDCGDFFY